jgi:hypothetical protein
VPLAVGAPSFSGPSASEFAANPSGAFVVAAGAKRDVVVRFRPLSTGARIAALRLPSDDADESVVHVALTGTGVEPDIDVDVRRVWGDLRVGTGAIGAIEIRNVGTSALSVSATDVRGRDASEFAIVSGGGSFVLGAGEARVLDVRFQPASPGAKNARIRVTSDDPDEEIANVAVVGNAIAPEISVEPASHDWGGVRPGMAAIYSFAVHNGGTADLAISETTVVGPNAADFTMFNGGGSRTIAPGATHEIELAFAPANAGPKTAVLRIASDDDDERVVTVAMSGAGVEPDIVVAAAHDWGDVRTGTPSPWAIEVRNTGTFALAVRSVTVEGPSAAEFVVTAGGGGFGVAPGAAHAIEVTFRPVGPGPKSAVLRIRSDDRDEGIVDVALAGRGIEPDVATAVTGVDWGDVRIATTIVRGLDLRNEGTADLAVSTASVHGPDAAEFTVVTGGSVTVAPGGTHRIDVRFGPSTTGSKAAALRIQTDDPDEPEIELALAGRGVEPEISVTPPGRDWGEVRVGRSSAWTFTVRNLGTGVLAVGGATVEGPDAANFRIAAGGGGFTVAPGAHGQIRVAFQPSATGTKSAALRIASDDADEPSIVLPLAGRGVEPDIAAEASHDWGEVRVDAVASGVIEVRNDGTSDLSVLATSVEGRDAAAFSVDGGGSFVVATGATRAIEVRCAPASAGAKSAVLRLASDDPDEPVVDVLLAANAVEPLIAINPPSRDFGDVRVGTAVSRLFQIRNDGGAPLAVAATGVGGSDASRFEVVSGGAPFAVAPGSTHEIRVRFRPGVAGPKVAILTIESDAARDPQVRVPLSGTGVAPDIAAAPGHDFGDVRVGAIVSHGLEVRNEGTADLLVSAPVIAGADSGEFLLASGGGFVLAPGASRAIEVSWRPAAQGAKSALLRLASDDPDEPSMDVSLAGRAIAPDVGVDPGDLDFGAVVVAPTAEAAGLDRPESAVAPGDGLEDEFLVTNDGTAPLELRATTLGGPDAGSFEIVEGGSGAWIAPGGTHRIVVRATVTTIGPKTAELLVASDDPDEGLLRVPLAARGVRVREPSGDQSPPDGPGRERDGDPQDPPGPHDVTGLLRTVVTGIRPNPSPGAATIEYALPSASEVTIVVYDANGRRVRNVLTAVLPGGAHATQWDGRDDFGRPAASGIYFVRLTAARDASIAKLVLRR